MHSTLAGGGGGGGGANRDIDREGGLRCFCGVDVVDFLLETDGAFVDSAIEGAFVDFGIDGVLSFPSGV